jgi:hypothetical protein
MLQNNKPLPIFLCLGEGAETGNYLLVPAGKFVSISGRLLVAMLELVPDASVELPGVFWLQPTNTSAARMVIVDSVIIDFISLLRDFRVHVFLDVADKRCPLGCVRAMGCLPQVCFFISRAAFLRQDRAELWVNDVKRANAPCNFCFSTK